MSAPDLSSLPSFRIVLFTNLAAEGAAALLGLLTGLGQQVPLVVTTPGPSRRPNTAYRDYPAVLPRGQDVLVTSHIRLLPAMLAPLEPDLIFTAGFPWLLPDALLALPRLGCINAHPALLPRYRGPDPLFWTFANGEREMGLTVHRMDGSFDTGPILAQRSIAISPDDDADSIFPKLAAAGAELLPRVLARVLAGEPGTPQPAEGASYARLITDDDRRLDWRRPAAELRNRVRACASRGALAEVDGRTLLVRRARVVDAVPSAAPGAVLDDAPLIVQTGADALLLEDAVPLDAGA